MIDSHDDGTMAYIFFFQWAEIDTTVLSDGQSDCFILPSTPGQAVYEPF